MTEPERVSAHVHFNLILVNPFLPDGIGPPRKASVATSWGRCRSGTSTGDRSSIARCTAR